MNQGRFTFSAGRFVWEFRSATHCSTFYSDCQLRGEEGAFAED